MFSCVLLLSQLFAVFISSGMGSEIQTQLVDQKMMTEMCPEDYIAVPFITKKTQSDYPLMCYKFFTLKETFSVSNNAVYTRYCYIIKYNQSWINTADIISFTFKSLTHLSYVGCYRYLWEKRRNSCNTQEWCSCREFGSLHITKFPSQKKILDWTER